MYILYHTNFASPYYTWRHREVKRPPLYALFCNESYWIVPGTMEG